MCRRGVLDGPTAGLAPGYAQANLVVVRETVAGDFERFCRNNPRPCPLLEITGPGRYEPLSTAPAGDLRTDLPRYRVFRDGAGVDRPTSTVHLWDEAARDGKGRFVAFLLGCSFTFEAALRSAGLPVRHIEESRNVPMFRTNVACVEAGPFHGPLVVSMRPMTPREAERAAAITEELPEAHGAPIHVGDPRVIGINDPAIPDYGDPVTIRAGEVPVFWACGVTPIEVIVRARVDLAITHEPGHMFITDLTASTSG